MKKAIVFFGLLLTIMSVKISFASDCPNPCGPNPVPDCYYIAAKNAGDAITVTQTPSNVWAYACCSTPPYSGLAAIQKLNQLAPGRSSGVSVSATDPNDRVQTWQWSRRGELYPETEPDDPDWCDCVRAYHPWATIPSEGLDVVWSGTVEFNKPGSYTLTATYTNKTPTNPCSYTHEQKVHQVTVSIIPDPNEEEFYGCNVPSLPAGGSQGYINCDEGNFFLAAKYYSGTRSWSYGYDISAIPGGPCGQPLGPITKSFSVGTTVESSLSAEFEGIGASIGVGYNTQSSVSYQITCPAISCRYVRAFLYQQVVCVNFTGLVTVYDNDECFGYIQDQYNLNSTDKVYTSNINWYCCNSANGMDWPATGDCECDE